jgi:hypothetical protein
MKTRSKIYVPPNFLAQVTGFLAQWQLYERPTAAERDTIAIRYDMLDDAETIAKAIAKARREALAKRRDT